jgi:hypothetical protein
MSDEKEQLAAVNMILDDAGIPRTACGGEGDAEVEINVFERMRIVQRRLCSPGLMAEYKRAAKDQGDLFCWCVQNLKKFPPIEGKWTEDVKRRLAEVDALLRSRDDVVAALNRKDAAIKAALEAYQDRDLSPGESAAKMSDILEGVLK